MPTYHRDEATRKAHQAIRQSLAHQPGKKQLMEAGDIEEPMPLQQFLELRSLLHQLKRARELSNLSLSELAEKSGLDRGSIWKLESGKQENPTIDSLVKLSRSLGYQLHFSLEKVTS